MFFKVLGLLTLVLSITGCVIKSKIIIQLPSVKTAANNNSGTPVVPNEPTDLCPANFVKIAANPDYSSAEFCIAKYEMKVSTNAGSPVFDGYNGGVELDVTQYKPESRPFGTPWVKITHANAIDECESLGAGYHLATAREWQIAVREIESVNANWSSGTIDSGELNTGHSDSTISVDAVNSGHAVAGSSTLSAENGTDPYVGTGNNSSQALGSGKEQKRTHLLKSGEEIWDMAGNVREIVDIDGAGGTLSYTGPSGSNYFEIISAEFSSLINSGITTNSTLLNIDWFTPKNSSLIHASNKIGRSYLSGGARTDRIITRGANFGASNFPGIYAVDFDQSSTASSGSAGFRCIAPITTFASACNFQPTNYMSASVVIGQADMNSGSTNQGLPGRAANTIAYSDGVSIANDKLFIGDFLNHRYLVFNSIPTSNNASADLIIGQSNATSYSTAVNAFTTSAGRQAVWTGSQLIVADGFNARLLVYNSFPTNSLQPADFVIGQSDFITNTPGLSSSKIDSSYGGLTVYNNKLWAADTENLRVLKFDLPITQNLPEAVLVLGQPNFTTANNAVSTISDMNAPGKVIFHGGKMIVADRWHNRVMIYNSVPTTNYAPADVVIGQVNNSDAGVNQGGTPAANTLNHPHSVAVDDIGRLYISDTLNNRVLVYNSIPTVNNAAADVVIGQANFTTNSANAGGPINSRSINRTTDLLFYNCSLIVGDQSNSRVLIFK